MSFGEIITWPFAKLMVGLYNLTGSYGWAIILFALIVNLILTPFNAKSKKSMMRSTRLQPRIQELQKKHEGNPQQLNAEMQKLYREEGVNPMSGCLWSLIPFPILIALYSVIRQPITRMMFASADVVTALSEYFAVEATGRSAGYVEIQLTKLAHENWAAVQSALGDKVAGLLDIDFGFLGLNLGDTPNWRVLFQGPYTWAAIGLFLIPFVSAGLSYLSMKISTASNPSTPADQQQQATMQSMNLMMPLMSIWICFVMPGAMGIYWIANSVFGMAREFVMNKIFKKQLDAEDAVRNAERAQRERELEERRLETERLHAEGKNEKNVNTSKKKIQANEKQQLTERKAALERADRAARRERLGIPEYEKPASQVGNRRYARGRAYVPDRFTNPDTAAELTAAAALASEDAPSIDESVADELSAAVVQESVDTVSGQENSAE